MATPVDILLVLVVLTNLLMLGSSRLLACIRNAAAQGAGLLIRGLVAHLKVHAQEQTLALGQPDHLRDFCIAEVQRIADTA